MISPPDPSPLTSQPLHTMPTSLHHSRSTLQPQSSPLTDIDDCTGTTDASTSAGLLESKHIFGIIVGGVLFIVLIIIGVVVMGFLLILTARRRNRHQFVETFIETTDNDAYTIRRGALPTQSHKGHIAQNLHMALIPHSNDSAIVTKNNKAYLMSSEASRIQCHQANDITVSTFMGPQNGGLHHTLNSHPNHNSIATERNIAYLTSSAASASAIQRQQAKHTRSPLTGLHNGDLNGTPNSSPDTIATERNIAYLTNSETSVARSHQANATASSPVMGTHKGDMGHAIEMKVNEAYHTKVSTLGHGLPDDTRTLVTMPEVSSSLAKGSRGGMGQGNRGQSSHREQLVKPYEIINLPSIVSQSTN